MTSTVIEGRILVRVFWYCAPILLDIILECQHRLLEFAEYKERAILGKTGALYEALVVEDRVTRVAHDDYPGRNNDLPWAGVRQTSENEIFLI